MLFQETDHDITVLSLYMSAQAPSAQTGWDTQNL